MTPPPLSPKKLPYHLYTLPVLTLLILGLADTGYLAWLHFKNYTSITFTSFCALSKAVNCDTVSQSPWSIFWDLPLAYWGMFAYLIFLILFLPVLHKKSEKRSRWYLLLVLAIIYSGISMFLGYISTTQIKAHCLLCMVSYAITFALLVYSWLIIRRFCTSSYHLKGISCAVQDVIRSPMLIGGILVLCGLLIITKFLLPPYWHFSTPALTASLPHGFTDKGYPWIGADQPQLTIHEYTDYQCFQCSKMHMFLRQLIAAHPQAIRLVHHHYPMDHEFNNIIVPEPFHIGSGKMAMLAIYAGSHNKFWEMNDALYTMGRTKEPFNTRTLATMTNFTGGELAAATRHPQIREVLSQEIRHGMKLEIIGTPTFVIDDKVYPGVIPAKILQPYLQ